MRTTARLLQHLVNGVGCSPVDGEVCAERTRERQLLLRDIDGNDVEAHGFRVLNGDVSQATNARDDDPLARPRLGLLDALVGRDAGAENRRQCGEVGTFRQAGDICG
jgi:hypothetical protein